MKSAIRKGAVIVLLVAAGVFLLNTNLLAPAMTGRPKLLAHRGLHQTFSSEDLESDTCTATRIQPPTHRYLENTIASMEAAFAAGAYRVEIDIHPTADGHFAVFHDWTIDCRTEGRGVTREKTLAELKALDIGYGYTADDGKTFPFRGEGVGLMPSLDEVLAAFPDKRLLINVKSRDAAEGRMLAARLRQLGEDARGRLAVYGDEAPIAALRETLADLRTMSRTSLKRCLTRYLGFGWSGHVPGDCHNTIVLVPVNYTWLLWGWPGRFLSRMAEVGSEVYTIGPYTGAFATGLDSAEDLGRLPTGYSGGIWTNRIEVIGPMIGAEASAVSPGGRQGAGLQVACGGADSRRRPSPCHK